MSTGITLCMIVKNEARFIEGCLKSVRSILDDIIIVDTGSTDQTLELIRPFSPQIIHFKWCDDFSAARNAGLVKARTPWILMLDADERIAERDLPLVSEAAKQEGYTGFELLWRNYGFNNGADGLTPNTGDYEEGNGYPGYSQDPMFRLYRNDPRLRYEGVVHEHITWKTFPNVKVTVVPAVIHHYGRALGESRKAQKGELYLRLGHRKLEEFPDRWEPLYEIALQLQEFDRYNDSISHLEKALTIAPLAEDRGRMLVMLAAAFKRTGKPAEAMQSMQQALAIGYDYFPVYLTLGNLYAAEGRLDEAAAQYELARKAGPDSALPPLNNGILLRGRGDLAGAEREFKAALEIDPRFSTPAIELAALYERQNRLEEAESLLCDVHRRDPGLAAAWQSLAKIYLRQNQPHRALELLPQPGDDPTSETLRGIAHSACGELETARSILENVIKKDRTQTGARINLATTYARLGEPGKAVRHLALAYEQTRDPSLLAMAAEYKQRQTI